MLTQKSEQKISSEQEMLEFGRNLAKNISSGVVIYLQGPLGAGKTTLTRAIIQGLGHEGNVKSPTYTLVEPYEINHKIVYHFDFYRVVDPQELSMIGIRDYFTENSICIIEWPERAQGMIPPADVVIEIEMCEQGRQVKLIAHTDKGKQLFK